MPAPHKRPAPVERIPGTDIGLPLAVAIGSIRARSAQRLAWHSHDGLELIFLLEGATAYEFKGQGVLELSGGQFLLAPARAPHRGTHDVRMPSTLCGIVFQPDRRGAWQNSVFTASDLKRLHRELQDAPPSVRTMSRELRGVAAQLADMVEALKRGEADPEINARLRAIVCLAILEAARLLRSRERIGATEMVAAAETYLRERHAEPVRMNDLAAHLGLSRARMFELFRSETGLSPNDYLLRHRIECAKMLLAAGDRTITDVAMETGFGSSQYFSRVFRKYCGLTPKEFRERR